MFDVAADLDWFLIDAVETIRWDPATFVFVAVSSWLVKGPLFVLLGGLADFAGRRWVPLGAAGGAIAATLASIVNALSKEVFDRERPPQADPSFEAVIAIPPSDSFPSGHAATAFAAATAVGLIHPRLARPLLALAATVAFSRVYLGVHFPFDVIVGGILGSIIGVACGFVLLRSVQHDRRESRLFETGGRDEER